MEAASVKYISKTSKKNFALNSQDLFHSHMPLAQNWYFYKPDSYFYTEPSAVKTPENIIIKKELPIIPIAGAS